MGNQSRPRKKFSLARGSDKGGSSWRELTVDISYAKKRNASTE